MEYRPLPEDRYRQFQEYVRYAFSPEAGPDADRDEDRDLDEEPGAPRGLFAGEDLLAVCRHYWFRVRLRDRDHEMPGLSAVASPPEHRRQGNVARMLEASLEEYRDRGDYLAALWAFKHPFYERQGWGLANKWARFECAPDALDFAREHAAGRFRPVEADEYAALDAVLAAHAEGFELAMDRTERWWRKRVFEGWRTDPYVYAWERDGEVRGYVVYDVEDEEDGKRLAAEELAYTDREAYLNLLRFLANHDSQVERVSVRGPPDTRLLDEVDDPARIDCEIKPGPMVRLVDVPRAVEALDSPDASGEFTLAVADPLADWNDRTFRVAVGEGRATCEPADDTDADVEANVATLSQLYVGYHSVEDAEQLGDLEIHTSEARETLAAMYPETDVFLREGF